MLELLTKWEPAWLLIILAWELYETRKSNRILEKEYDYDREWNERMLARKARRAAAKKEHAPIPPQ